MEKRQCGSWTDALLSCQQRIMYARSGEAFFAIGSRLSYTCLQDTLPLLANSWLASVGLHKENVANMRLALLGPVQITPEGQPASDLPLGKPLAILGYLVAQRKPLPREHLADLFWQDLPSDRGRANLSWMLHRLTTMVPNCLEASRHSVQFHRSEACWIDIDAVQAFTAEGDAQSLAEAVALYRGEFLEGLSLDGCADFELWLVGERERWRQRAERALSALIAHHAEARACEDALRYARRLLELAPWREGTHRQVMRLLAEQGHRGAALAQYRACCRALEEELGVAPTPETEALRDRICVEAMPRPSRVAAPAPVRHNLPAQTTPFIGRRRDLEAVRQRLEDAGCRLLTLVGPGGCGKTRLALEAARTQIDRYGDGVFLVSLAPLSSPEGIVPAIAQSVGLAFHGSGEARQQLLDYGQGKHMLLLLDNLEHLPDGADLAVEILRVAPRIKLLATSRARLGLQAEHLYPLAGLPCPDPEDERSRDLRGHGAVQLFVDGARRAKPDFVLHHDQLAAVASICRLVEGMPLAILLAAAWVERHTPARIAVEIERNLDFLATGWRDLPERQRSMRAVYDHSCNLLSAQLRPVMRALSVFRGSFTREAALAVSGASADDLRALSDRSLLHRIGEERFELHQLLQQYASEELATEAQDLDRVQARHGRYYIALMTSMEAQLKGSAQRAAIEEMDAEIQNIVAAWRWTLSHTVEASTAAQLTRISKAMGSLWLFYDIQGRIQEGERTFATAGQLLGEPRGRDRAMAARAMARQARFSFRMGFCEEAQELCLRSLEAFRLLGARSEMAFCLSSLGQMAYDLEEHREAEQHLQESLLIYREHGDRWGIAYALHHLGVAAYKLGKFAQAERYHRDALNVRRDTGERWGTAKSLKALGAVLHDLGDLPGARKLYRESYAICDELGDQRGMAAALNNQAALAWGTEAYDEAGQLLQEALRICEEIGDRKGISLALTNLGYVARLRKAFGEARTLYQRSLAASRDRGDRWGVALSLIDLGAVARELREYPEAKRCYYECIAICEETDHLWGKALCMNRLGRIACYEGLYEEAEQYYEDSLRMSQDIGDQRGIATSSSDLGDVARASGDLQACRRRLAKALSIATAAGTVPLIVDIAVRTAELLASTDSEQTALALATFAMHHFTDQKEAHARAQQLSSGVMPRLTEQFALTAQASGRSWDVDDVVEVLRVTLEA